MLAGPTDSEFTVADQRRWSDSALTDPVHFTHPPLEEIIMLSNLLGIAKDFANYGATEDLYPTYEDEKWLWSRIANGLNADDAKALECVLSYYRATVYQVAFNFMQAYADDEYGDQLEQSSGRFGVGYPRAGLDRPVERALRHIVDQLSEDI